MLDLTLHDSSHVSFTQVLPHTQNAAVRVEWTVLPHCYLMSTGQSEAPVISAQRIGKSFRDVWVVRDLDLVINSKEIFCLLGPSGSGKTTTLRMLLGVFPPDEGKLQVFGQPPQKQGNAYARQMGYLSQLFVLYPTLSIQENLNFIGLLYGMGIWDRRRRIRELLELVELTEHKNKTAGNISGGMQRRLGLAAALMHRPKLLFVDEPTAGIDPILRDKFWKEFRRLNTEEDTTIIVTTQYVTEAEYCDNVAILSNGRVAASGTPDQLREQALGGEVIQIKATSFNQTTLSRLTTHLMEMKRFVKMDSPTQLGDQQVVELIVTGEAETIMREILQICETHGTHVESIGEVTPNFDEVFVRLVRRYENENRDPVKP
jgi:ABC-2 type transport system ATP-binding protein